VPYQIAVDRAEARLASARLGTGALKATYRRQLAELQSARTLRRSTSGSTAASRFLVAADFTSRSVYERAETDLKVARQHIASIGQQIANTVAALNGDPNLEIDLHPTARPAIGSKSFSACRCAWSSTRSIRSGACFRASASRYGLILAIAVRCGTRSIPCW
jgi:hypothetical protein